MLTIGLGILLIDFALLNVLQTLLMLFCLRLIQGIGNSIQATSAGDDGGGFDPKGTVIRRLRLLQHAPSSPWRTGPLLGLAVVETYGFQALFRVALLLTSVAFGLSFYF